MKTARIDSKYVGAEYVHVHVHVGVECSVHKTNESNDGHIVLRFSRYVQIGKVENIRCDFLV